MMQNTPIILEWLSLGLFSVQPEIAGLGVCTEQSFHCTNAPFIGSNAQELLGKVSFLSLPRRLGALPGLVIGCSVDIILD